MNMLLNPFWFAAQGGGGGGGDGFQLVGSKTFEISVTAGTEVVTLPDGEEGRTIEEGDFVMVFRACDDGNLTVDSPIATSGYTNAYDAGGVSLVGAAFDYKFMGVTPDSLVEIGGSDVRKQAGIIVVWRGVNSSTPLDVAVTTASGTSGMPNSPSITPVTSGCMIFAAGFLDDDDAAASVTVPAGYGGLVSGDTGLASTSSGATAMLANVEQEVAAAIDADAFGGTGNDTWEAIAFALRPAA